VPLEQTLRCTIWNVVQDVILLTHVPLYNVLSQIAHDKDGFIERENAALHASNALTLLLQLKTKFATPTMIPFARLVSSMELIALLQFHQLIRLMPPLPSDIATPRHVLIWMTKLFVS